MESSVEIAVTRLDQFPRQVSIHIVASVINSFLTEVPCIPKACLNIARTSGFSVDTTLEGAQIMEDDKVQILSMSAVKTLRH